MDSIWVTQVLAKHPDLRHMGGLLEQMKPGAYCVHRAWGFGQIVRYDTESGRLIIDFKAKPNHPMDPVFCLGKLDILAPDHLLVRYHQDPVAVDKMAPADLLAELLSYAPRKSFLPSEIEQFLKAIWDEAKIKRWWTAVRKELAQDPRFVVPAKKSDPYTLREDRVPMEQEVLEEFYLTKNPKKKISLAAKLQQLAVVHVALQKHLGDILAALTEVLKESKMLNLAERLQGCWVRNDLARHLELNPDDLEPTSASLLQDVAELPAIAEAIAPVYYKRFLDLITRVHLQDWEKIMIHLLKGSSGKLTHDCIVFLMEHEATDAVAYALKKWLGEQTLKAPVLQWIVKNRRVRRFKPVVGELMGPRLLSVIFQAVDYEALQANTTKRVPLAEQVFEDPDLIQDLLVGDEPTPSHVVRDLVHTLILSQGFDSLSKNSVLARFIKAFPEVQALIGGDEAPKAVDQLLVSRQSFEAKQHEYELLITEKIPENKQAIVTAREHGDLRENSEYKMARQDQETLMAQKAQLEADLARAQITDFTDATDQAAGIGTVVTLKSAKGKVYTYTLLGAWDSDPDQHILSYQTPLAQQLLGKTVGDSIMCSLDGRSEEVCTLSQISRWVDVAGAKSRQKVKS